MSDVPNASDAGARLAREVARLAGRLAELLAQTPEPLTDAAAAGLEFVHAVAATRADDLAPGDPPHPIDRLTSALRLTDDERDVLLLAGMAEEHEGFATLFRALHPRGEPRPTAGLAAQLLCDTADARRTLRASLVDGTATRSGAVRLAPDDAPFWERSLLPADLLWPTLAGLEAWPNGLQPLPAGDGGPGLAAWLDGAEARRAAVALAAGDALTVLVVARREDDALHRAAALARHAGVRAAAFAPPMPATVLPNVPHALDEGWRLVALHALARGVVPVLRVAGADGGGAPPALPQDLVGPVLVAARDGVALAQGSRPLVVVHAARVDATARGAAWRAALPELADDAPSLGARYALEPHAVAAVATDARAAAGLDGRVPNVDDVAASVRARSALSLAGGVQLVRPTAGWDRLVLAPDRLAQLREALDRLLHQSRVIDEWGFLRDRAGARGVRMLFSGPPGTGKTLAAEVMAHTLGVDLLVVDLSRVVSKWIGETEKNLAEVFDASEHAQAVLLFDEADALFGKRTEVSDAHDRYANLETAYLLSRLERFEGLAVLSTNLRENIDDAFTRRLEFLVDFDPPASAEREALWRCHLPPDAPLADDVRLGELATLYPLVGGHIRNASVAAGFLASAAGTPITRGDLVRAVRREYEKSGRAFPGAPA